MNQQSVIKVKLVSSIVFHPPLYKSNNHADSADVVVEIEKGKNILAVLRVFSIEKKEYSLRSLTIDFSKPLMGIEFDLSEVYEAYTKALETKHAQEKEKFISLRTQNYNNFEKVAIELGMKVKNSCEEYAKSFGDFLHASLVKEYKGASYTITLDKYPSEAKYTLNINHKYGREWTKKSTKVENLKRGIQELIEKIEDHLEMESSQSRIKVERSAHVLKLFGDNSEYCQYDNVYKVTTPSKNVLTFEIWGIPSEGNVRFSVKGIAYSLTEEALKKLISAL